MDIVSKIALTGTGSPAGASSFLKDTFQMTSQRLHAFQSINGILGSKNISAAIQQVPEALLTKSLLACRACPP